MLALLLLPAILPEADPAEQLTPLLPVEEVCEPPQPGFLTLDTHPWTVVYVDGDYVGTTPLFHQALPPGPHTLTLVNEHAGVLSHEDVVIDEGRARKLKILLAAVDSTTAIDATQPAPVKAEDCFLPLDETAYLTVETRPWSQVYLDGRRLGTTPLFRSTISPGDHVVRMVRTDGTQAFARFAAVAGEVVKLSIALGGVDPAGP